MKKFEITWTREEYGECTVQAESKLEAEEKAEMGEHGKVISLGFGGSAGWVISDVKEMNK